MNNIQYLIFTGGTKKFYNVEINQISEHVISIKFNDDVPAESTMRGFMWYYNNKPLGNYVDYTTVYRYDRDQSIYQLSNDGSIYVPPAPPAPPETVTVTFATTDGGELTGETSYTVPYQSTMNDVVVPAAVADEHYDFIGWSPEIVETDVLTEDRVYTAMFELQYEYTVEGKIAINESNIDYLAMEAGVELL